MRLWSLHPKYLDRIGLIACWRESLLAQNVLLGDTTGYRHHPQLIRFRAACDPIAAIGGYLVTLADEAFQRNYHFTTSKIISPQKNITLPVSDGQLHYEFEHLQRKLCQRDHARYHALCAETVIKSNRFFCVYHGSIEEWEIVR